MKENSALKIQLEIIWWLITLLLLTGLLYPIYQTKADYLFWVPNTIFILVFLTFTRYIFLLKHTFLAYWQIGKAILFILCIPLFFYLFNEMAGFQVFLSEVGLEETFEELPMTRQGSLIRYVQSEMLFFGTGSIIVSLIMPVRMLISFWRTHNRGTV